jgi:hypothetical protein
MGIVNSHFTEHRMQFASDLTRCGWTDRYDWCRIPNPPARFDARLNKDEAETKRTGSPNCVAFAFARVSLPSFGNPVDFPPLPLR